MYISLAQVRKESKKKKKKSEGYNVIYVLIDHCILFAA
jgi:hypothetical protein